MQKVVIDTNVLVSSLIQRSYPYLIVNNLVIEGKVELCVSEQLMAEYCEVLIRPKFSSFLDFFCTRQNIARLYRDKIGDVCASNIALPD